jgi:F0F1-type ATP synthase assembly protein I
MFIVSIVLGWASSAVPNLLYRKFAFASIRGTPEQVVKNFYLGVVLKFVSFVLLFSAFLHIPNIQTTVLFWAFLFAELSRWIWRWFSVPRILNGR